jgi:hypothetical protein
MSRRSQYKAFYVLRMDDSNGLWFKFFSAVNYQYYFSQGSLSNIETT